MPMSRLRSPVPEALSGQAQACVAASAQAALLFRSPTADNAFAARAARIRSWRCGLEAAAKLKGGRFQQQWLDLSRRLAEAAQESAAAAAEACRFGVAGFADLAAMSAGLRDSVRDLGAALKCLDKWPSRCEALMVAAKRRAAEAERLGRSSRAAALESHNAVADLKARTVLHRLGRAAEACQQAADRIAEILETRT